MGREAKTIGISMQPELIEDAKKRAKSLGLNMSSYVQCIIKKDILQGGPLTISETFTPKPARKKTK